MSWPPNQPSGGNNTYRPPGRPGRPGQYDDINVDDPRNSHVPNQPPWGAWPPHSSHPPHGMLPRFVVGPPLGAPFAYPHHFVGHATAGMTTPQHLQGWGNTLPVVPGGQLHTSIPPTSATVGQQQYRLPLTTVPRSPDEKHFKSVENGSSHATTVRQEQQPKRTGAPLPKNPMTLETLENIKEWASSLVGRDWEIFWNDDKDNQEIKREENSRDEDDNEGNSVGGMIDDWYDGRILSADVLEDGTVQGCAIFVGDDTVYEMELLPSKVRPSARCWIKRTTSLLLRKDGIPPDTASPEDQRVLKAMDEACRQYEPLSLPSMPTIRAPTLEELNDILSLRKKLKFQIYLRSKLASIINLHGSVKYVGGELNPTEPLVNHLVECCNDLDHACAWYLRCWELLTKCFGQKSGRANEARAHQQVAVNYTQLLDDYLEFGKNCILNCASMDTESTSSKRRQLVVPPGQRRTKRRRKNCSWGDDNDFEVFVEEDFRSTVAVDRLAQKLKPETRWYLPLFATMLQALSHHVVDPTVHWMCRANQLLGRSDDLLTLLEETEEDAASSRAFSRGETRDDDTSDVSSPSERQQFFPFNVVEECINVLEDHKVLSLLDVSEEVEALYAKLEVITDIAKQAMTLLDCVGKDCTGAVEDSSKDNCDEVLGGLRRIAKQLESPEHCANNIDPLGFGQVQISRDKIEDAILWRRFLLDVWHLSSVRERKQFIEDLATRMTQLPDPIGLELKDCRAMAEQQLREKVKTLASMAEVESKYEALILDPEIDLGLMSKYGLEVALEGLSSLPVLLSVEEKLSLRLSYIQWSELALESLPSNGKTIQFSKLENLYERLDRILKGKTDQITRMTTNLKTSERIENTVKAFIDKDANIIDSIQRERVVHLYRVSSHWKDRADAIISALRVHGNIAAGETIPSAKLPSLVDIKRISDLVVEYKGLAVDIPGYTSILQSVLDSTAQWSSRLEADLLREQSVKESAKVLAEGSQCRPKGLIMDPTRQVLDMVGELLDWHHRSIETWGSVMSVLLINDIGTRKQALSELIRKQVYPLLAEGLDVVECYSQINNDQHEVSAELSVKRLDNMNIRRSAKALVHEKIVAHPFGELLLKRIVTKEFDRLEGSPVGLHMWADWHLAIAEFVGSVGSPPEGYAPPTLARALVHRFDEPGQLEEGESSRVALLCGNESIEKAQLGTLIKEAEDIEMTSRALLSGSRELRKACLEKFESIRGHLVALKDHLSAIKERTTGKHGLVLDPMLESQVEHHVKIFSWLVKTLSYRFLYLDEASYASFSQQDARIPWDILVPLFEKLPPSDDSIIDDFALVSLRIGELYKAAKKWQDEITRSTLLSNRGGKRRNQGNSPTKEHDQETSSKLQIEKMMHLADDPILQKVAMPRETAVKTILRRSQDFEMKLHAFLGQDFDVTNADRMSYPSSRSLVGKKGEFVLFRLTGSELFESVLQVMQELSAMAENVFAETPETITFEWIQRAVTWLDELNEAVTNDSPFGTNHYFMIPEDKGRVLFERGDQILSDVPRDLKTTLSQHGIFVSRNKVDQTLKVTLKKDGAHHSVGGTVIRWCPILLKCLKSDLLRRDEWQNELMLLTQDFKEFQSRSRDDLSYGEEYMYDWYRFRERATYLWDEGTRSLVVSPRSVLVVSFNILFNKLKEYYQRHTKPEFDRKFSRMWFLEGRPITDHRFTLMESLLYRRSLEIARDEVRLPADGQKTFRDSCKSILLESFSKVIKSVGMHRLSDRIAPDVLQSLCSIRTWEIENEIFARFQFGLGITRASPEYFAKVRNLKASLNENNSSLVLEILLGHTTAQKLVNMSSSELASQAVKAARAKAEDEARNAVIVAVPEVDPSSDNGKEQDTPETPRKWVLTGKPPSILRKPRHSTSPREGAASVLPTYSSDDEDSTGSPPGDYPVSAEGGYAKSEDTLTIKLTTFRADSPPPPPPSLLNAFQDSVESSEDEEYGNRISCSSGGDEFQFDIINLRLSFRAALCLEESKPSKVDRFLPEILAEKGRLSDEGFSNWISAKAASGRWAIISLRLVPLSDEDDRQLTKLSQSYQRKNRIAMIAPSADTKVFILTPEFHAAAEETQTISFGNRLSSYAVVLTKDARFV